jgi:hypothetical protein
MKGRGKFLKYLFKEHPRRYTYGQATRILTAPPTRLSMQSSA